MSTVQTRGLVTDIRDQLDVNETQIEIIIGLLGEAVGNVFYVSTSGSDSNGGTSWADAFRTLIYAVSQCTSGNGDIIFMAPGTYDETANGSSGIVIDVANLVIQGIGEGVDITNSNIENNGRVFYCQANDIKFVNLGIEKGEETATGTVLVTFDGCKAPFLINCHLHLHTADSTGLKLTGGVESAFISGAMDDESRIHGHDATGTVGIGIDFDDCTFCTTEYIHLENLETAVIFRADGDANLLQPSTVIAACGTGISLESGAQDNVLLAVVSATTTPYLDLSGNATNDRGESLTSIRENQDHIPKFTGHIWFVSDTNGLDTNSGRSPDEAFATIGNALNNAAEGDAITIEAGDYYENNLDLNLIGTEIWGEIGVTIYNATGTGLTVSARNCRVNEIIIISPAQTALDVSGNYNVLTNITCPAPAIGVSLSGEGNRLRDFIIGAPTTTGLDISGPYNDCYDVLVTNPAVAARGYYLSSADADQNTLQRCHSIGNTIAGFEVVMGADYNAFIKCTSGGGDGKRIDSGDFTFWDIIEELTTEQHESMLPMSDGEGIAGAPITVDNIATDDTPDTTSDQDYWGDTMAIILPDVLTTWWSSIGLYIFATTIGKTLQWQVWFPDGRVNSARNAGNVWDLGQTILTVTDGTLFLVNDYVWIRSDSDPDGEILIIINIAGNVITITSETRFSGNSGVRYDHVGNEAMYLIYRPTDDRYSGFNGGYAASSAKDCFRVMWHTPKEVSANSGMIIRLLNTGDNLDAEFDVNALYTL